MGLVGHKGQGGKQKEAGGKGKKRGRKKRMVSWGEWEWEEDAEFIIEKLIGRMVADGGPVPGRSNVPAGTVLYKCLWDGWPEEIATWEDEDDIPLGEFDFIADYEARMAAGGAAADAADSDGRICSAGKEIERSTSTVAASASCVHTSPSDAFMAAARSTSRRRRKKSAGRSSSGHLRSACCSSWALTLSSYLRWSPLSKWPTCLSL